MTTRRRFIRHNTRTETLRRWLTDPALARVVTVSASLSAKQICSLVDRELNEDFFSRLVERLVEAPCADEGVLRHILELTHDEQIENEILMRPGVSTGLLKRLARSKNRSVSEHARQGLVFRRLAEVPPAQIRRLVQRHNSGSMGDANVRYFFAIDRRTPHDVLLVLAKDPTSFVRQVAQERLRNEPFLNPNSPVGAKEESQ